MGAKKTGGGRFYLKKELGTRERKALRKGRKVFATGAQQSRKTRCFPAKGPRGPANGKKRRV